MKKLSVFCLLAFPVCCFCQTKTVNIDSLFEKHCQRGVILETEMSKYQFDTSETILIRGIARNCSKTDSVFFAAQPTSADYNISFTLRNVSSTDSYAFNDFDLVLDRYNSSIVRPVWKPIFRKLAPGERVEVFSFDLSKLKNLRIGGNLSQIHICIRPDIYEFNWASGLSGAVGKPVFFEIR